MSRTLRRTAILVTITAGVAAGVWFASRPDPVHVRVRTVERGDVAATVANTRAGTIEAAQRARLAPAVGGSVAALPVDEGDRVAAGDVLLELWNDDLTAEHQLAGGELQRAESLVEEACQRAQLAEREAARLRDLQRDDVSAEAVDRAESEARALVAAWHAAEAQVRVQHARIAKIAAALDRTVLRAPFAGIVAEVNAELGEYVTPSPPGIPTLPAIDLIDDSSLHVVAPIDEVDAAAVAVGMTARVTVDAFPGREFAGVVRRVAPYVLDREKQARTVDVEVALVDPEDRAALLAGYSADVEVILEVRSDVVRVPTEAITGGDLVWVVTPDGLLEERRVELGIGNWSVTEVKSGLDAGELVAIALDDPEGKRGERVLPQPMADRP